MQLRLILITIFTPFAFNLAIAQTKPAIHIISGIVADSASKKPLDYITVSLKNEKNVVVKTSLTKPNGLFSIPALGNMKYSLSVVAVGYKTKIVSISLTDSTKKETNLGTIYISTRTGKLKEVLITGDKPIVKQEIDRISYDLQADPESKGNNVLEMMRKVPLLSLDGDDNIQLKGNSNYKILLNGKPSSMLERSPKDILRSMPASSIERIEVITTPPAKYDAEGLTGIINIITNKKVDNGYNGSLNTSGKYPVGGPGIGGSFTVKQGKIGANFFGGASTFTNPATQSSNSRLTSGSSLTNLNQYGNRKSDGKSGYFGSEISYELDTLNLISGQININGNRNDGSSEQNSLLNGNNEVLQSYRLLNSNESEGRGFDAALNYQLGFKSNKNRLLTFSYRFFNFNNDQFSNLGVSNRVKYPNPDYNQTNIGKSTEQTFQIDYAHPIKKVTIETGIKGIFRNNQSDFRYDTLNTGGIFETDAKRSNVFTNDQDVYAFYNSYQLNLKNWGLKGGVRVEHTSINAGKPTEQNYTNLTPSLSINRKFKNMSSMNFGFAQRIQRPGIQTLNPFIDRSNPNFESGGNPNLRPMSNTSFELKYSKFKKGSVNIALMYILFDKIIMPTSVFDPATNITRTSFGNTGKARIIGSQININYPVTKKLNFTANGQGVFGKVEGVVNNVKLENDGFMYFLNTFVSYRFEKGLRLNANIYANGRNLSLQGSSNAFVGTSFGINKDLIKDKLSFTASANNPFNKYRVNNNYVTGTNFSQQNNNQTYFRSFSASLNYKFGKLKSAVKKSRKGIVNDDISSGTQ